VPDDGAAFLMNAGISTYIDAKYAVALNKTTVSDKKFVIYGRIKFTKPVEGMERILFINQK